jgi:hypothetical protein
MAAAPVASTSRARNARPAPVMGTRLWASSPATAMANVPRQSPRPVPPIVAIQPLTAVLPRAPPTPSARRDSSAWLAAAARVSTARAAGQAVIVLRASAWTASVATSPAAVPAYRATRLAPWAIADSSLRACPALPARPTIVPPAAQPGCATDLARARSIRNKQCVVRLPVRVWWKTRPELVMARALAGIPNWWTARPFFASPARAFRIAPATQTARSDTSAFWRTARRPPSAPAESARTGSLALIQANASQASASTGSVAKVTALAPAAVATPQARPADAWMRPLAPQTHATHAPT